MATPIVALLIALAAAATTMLGWLIAVAKPNWRPRTSGWLLLLAATAMLLVSFTELLPQALSAGSSTLTIALLVGAGAAVVFALHTIGNSFDFGGNDLQRSAVVIAVALAIHNFPEGAAPYAAALLSVQGGLLVAISLGLHNIAEGLAVATPVMAAGGTRRRAFWLTMVATVGEMAGAVVAFALTAGINAAVAGQLIAFVAGVMITVSLLEVLPAALRLLRTAETCPIPPGNERVREPAVER